MKHSRALVSALLLIVLALTACGGSTPTVLGETTFDGDLAGESSVASTTFIVEPGMTDTYLRLRIDLSEGAVGYVITDPTGETRWSGRVEAESLDEEDAAAATAAAESPEDEEEPLNLYEFDEERFFPPIEGEWTLVVTAEEATGHY
ncbi:MAG: hypothetical protein JW910_15700, partial [Anaerolineae bacterium]|nr:hypothetical protein [Anaerolineae bacterium]